MKYNTLVSTEVAAINATLKAMPAVIRQSVPTAVRVYGQFIPAMKAMRKLGYGNEAIASAIFAQSKGRVGPVRDGRLNSWVAAQYVSIAINYKG